LKITIKPLTQIVAPIIDDTTKERYLRLKWLTDERLDRAFPRSADGKAYIPQTPAEERKIRNTFSPT